jgi:hypothetical protein
MELILLELPQGATFADVGMLDPFPWLAAHLGSYWWLVLPYSSYIMMGGLVYTLWQEFAPARLVLSILGGLFALALAYDLGLLKYRNFLRQQQPRDGELTRASHGIGIIVLLVVAGIALRQIWRWQLSDFIGALQAGDPLTWVPALLLLLVITWAVLWVMTGIRRSLAFGAERDSRVITRSVLKILAGAALVLVLFRPPQQYAGAIAFVRSVPYLPFAVMALAGWLAATGAMKFSLALKGRRKPPKPPVEPTKDPARDATEDEAAEDMQGHGGRRTSLDDEEF